VTGPEAWAIVPVKPLALCKLRLASVLRADDRRSLSLAMLQDVVTTLQQVRALGAVAVVSRDEEVLGFVRGFGIRTLRETGSGENAAVAAVARSFGAQGCATLLVVPADVPLATPAEFSTLVQARRAEHTVTLVPDRARTGTNAMALSPPTVIPPLFGHDSLARHRHAALQAGAACRVIDLHGLGLDIDRPADLAELLRRGEQTHAHACLRRLMDSGRVAAPQAPSPG